ncbi:hypothetical protein ACP275_10G032900 [Erythranthe tilingii]
MENLLCNEVWLMTPDNVRENGGSSNANANVESSLFLSKEDCEEALGVFLGKEATYMPQPPYFQLLDANRFLRNARFKSVTWLLKSQRRMNLCRGTVFIAVNYFDRFVSVTHECQEWKQYWMFELLSVACLSVASKFNETTMNLQLHEFQVEGDLEKCFDPGLIQRMELRLMKALGWRMDSTTPFSYIDILIHSIHHALNKTVVHDFTHRVNELLLAALLDPKFLEFRQCVVAISAVKRAFEELSPSIDIASLAHLDNVVPQDQKGDLIKCGRIMGKLLSVQDHDNMLVCANSWHCSPSSPVTVLKAECFNFDDYQVENISLDLGSGVRKRKWEESDFGL